MEPRRRAHNAMGINRKKPIKIKNSEGSLTRVFFLINFSLVKNVDMVKRWNLYKPKWVVRKNRKIYVFQ